MFKRILTFGAAIAVFITALILVLRILDIVTMQDAGRTLVKTLSIVAVGTITIVLMRTLVRIGKSG
jgi:hypothetical protein